MSTKTLVAALVALVMSASYSAKAGTPKTTDNATAKTESKAENYVWYPVTYDGSHPSGYIPAGTSIVATGDKADAEEVSDCPEGTNRDCLRGFQAAPTLPSSSLGDDQTKRD